MSDRAAMVTGAGGVLGRATAATLARPATEPTAGTAACSVTKAALVHLTRVVDAELRRTRWHRRRLPT